jgi:hypothetical protein
VFEIAGFTVHAGQRNLAGVTDLLVVGALTPLHVECKRQERLRIPEWIAQAQEDAPAGVPPVVVFRQNRGEWFAVLELADLLRLIR